jgi:hypothetical protein
VKLCLSVTSNPPTAKGELAVSKNDKRMTGNISKPNRFFILILIVLTLIIFSFASEGTNLHAESPINIDKYIFSNEFSETQGERSWYYQYRTAYGYYNMFWDSGNSRWEGNETYVLIGDGWFHPGNNSDAALKWIAPQKGLLTISGTVEHNQISPDCPEADGVEVKILHGNTEVWSHTLEILSTVSHELSVDVAAGDPIYFTVNKRSNNSCDTTNWAPTLTFIWAIQPGDVNADGDITLADALLSQRVACRQDLIEEYIAVEADVNGDHAIGVAEAVYALQAAAGLRQDLIDNDGDGLSEQEGDCNDADAAVHPGATDTPCDGIDQDCLNGDAVGPSCLPPEPGQVHILGTVETVFDWTTDQCEAEDIPDLPARAFRDSNDKVQLIATHMKNRRMIGDNLDSLVRDCNVIMNSDHDPDPAMYNDSEWINATYTIDGETIYALIHNEYQGSAHPGQCPSGSYINCWYNSITMAVSLDSGQTYTHASAPDHLVASVPYQYVPDAGPYGIFEGSNILYNTGDGYYYKMLHLEDYGLQKRGACVMRTQDLADPTSWRAWDGEAFNVRFINPYTEIGYDPADHICEPVSFDKIDKMADNITFNTFFNKFMLVGTASRWDPEREEEEHGFYYSLSDDLIHWSERKLIMEGELWWTSGNWVDRIGYPALIDPTDTSRNFTNTGQRPYLYFTRWNKYTDLDRDLVRIQIEFTQ